MQKNDTNDYLTNSLRECMRAGWFIVLFSLASNLLMLGLPIYTLQLLDRVVSTQRIETLVMLTIVTSGMFVFLGLFNVARSLTFIKAGEWLDSKTSLRLLSNSLSTAAARPDVNVGQNIRDLGSIRGFITGNGMVAFADAPWSLVFLVVVFFIHPVLGFIALGGSIMLFLMALLNEVAMRKPLNDASEFQIKNFNYVETSSRNAEVIEAMGMKDAILGRWSEENDKVMRLQAQASSRSAVIVSIAKAARLLLQVAIMGTGGYLFLQNAITIGSVIACSILTGRVLAPFEMAIGTWNSFKGATKSYYRVQKSILQNPERPATLALPEPKGNIIFEKVIYAAPGSKKPILKGINFSIKAGDSVGIVGPSGAGKSTIVKLMSGVWPANSGVVRLDNADVFTWDRAEFGKYIGYLPQDVELFAGTVKENIARMQKDIPPEEIVKAAKIAGVHELILHLPDGYETNIGVGGASLSAGQRQRIALARAFFGIPKLLILDEPNSNLDEVGESSLLAALQNAKKLGITTVIVSHRPNILTHVDTIMVMQDGLISDFGAAKDIMGKYRRGGANQQPNAKIQPQGQSPKPQVNNTIQSSAKQNVQKEWNEGNDGSPSA